MKYDDSCDEYYIQVDDRWYGSSGFYADLKENEKVEASNDTSYTEPQTTSIEDEKASEVMEVEHVFLDSSGKIVEKITTSQLDLSAENRRGKAWTTEEEELITRYFNQGKSIPAIASAIGRTMVAIKSRLGKLGLINYTYGQEDETDAEIPTEKKEQLDEKDFKIENSYTRCSILDKNGDSVFTADGKLKYIGGKLYRFNLKNECFTIRSMRFDGSIWLKGDKIIVAYPQTELYRKVNYMIDYWDEVEEISHSPLFEDCKLKIKGVWYKYNGDLFVDEKEEVSNTPKRNIDRMSILKNPLYAVRRQAVLRAMSFFRLPARIKDIARTISRTAWRNTIKEEDVEDIISTMPEVESVDGGYILRKKE